MSREDQHKEGEEQKHFSLFVRIIKGAGLATGLLTLAFLTMGASNTEDLRWMILPYITVPAAGALGGLIFHLMTGKKRDHQKVLTVILSVLLYMFLLGVGFVLGMNGPD